MLQALDGQHLPSPDLALVDVRLGDRLLVCSDGLTDPVDGPWLEPAGIRLGAVHDPRLVVDPAAVHAGTARWTRRHDRRAAPRAASQYRLRH